MSPPPPERLDVESDESREARLGNLFSSLTSPATSAPAPPPGFPMPPSRPGPMAESDVLARARAFLPLMAASNASLLQRAAADPSSVSVENPTGEHVAMDVGLGVFDVQGSASAAGETVGPTVERDAAVWEAAAAAAAGDDEDEEDEEDEDEEGRGKGVLVREEPEDEEMSSGVDTSDSDSSSDGDSSPDEE